MRNTQRVSRGKCWGHGYGCSGRIEKEHVISNGLLKEFGHMTFKIGPKPIKLGTGTFVTTSLCAKHNRNLRGLDSEAIRFFSAWRDTVRKPATGTIYEFDGYKIENWFAKTMVNSLIFRNQAFRKYTSPPLLVSFEHIKKVLFGGSSFKSPYGLYTKWPQSERVVNDKNWMSIQTKEGFLIKKDTGMCYKHEIPWCFAVNFYGIKLLGFFNMSVYNDNDAPTLMPIYSKAIDYLNNCKYRNFYIASGDSGFENANKLKLIF